MKKLVVTLFYLVVLSMVVTGCQKEAEISADSKAEKAPCESCAKGLKGETVWCDSCKKGFVDGKAIKCKSCFLGKKGETVWCDSCNKGFIKGEVTKCKGCVEAAKSGTECESCKLKKEGAAAHSKGDGHNH